MLPDNSAKPDDAIDRRLFIAALALSAAAVLVTSGPLFTGTVLTHSDNGNFNLPIHQFYHRCLHEGHSPVWSPDIYGGFYLHGEGQAGMYHPLHWLLYRFLPLTAAFDLELFACFPLLLAGTALLLRRWDLPRSAAVFGGFVFAFSAYNSLHFMYLHLMIVTAHLPWLLLAIDIAIRGGTRRSRVGGALAVVLLTASQLLLGHPYSVYLGSLIEGLYAVFLCLRFGRPRMLALLAIAKALAILIAAVQLIPTLDALLASQRPRGDPDFNNWGYLHPVNLAQAVAPYLFKSRVLPPMNGGEFALYPGAAVTVLLVWLIVRFRHLGPWRPLAASALALAALGFILALGKDGYLYRLVVRLPILDSFRFPTRHVLLVHLGAGIIAAIAWADLLGFTRRGERASGRGLAALFAVALAAWLLAAMVLVFKRIEAPPFEWMSLVRRACVPSIWKILAGPVLVTLAVLFVVMASRGRAWALAALAAFAAADLTVYGVTYQWDPPPMAVDAFAVSRLPMPDPILPGGRIDSMDMTKTMTGGRLIGGYVAFRPARRLDYNDPSARRVAGVCWKAVWIDHIPDLEDGLVGGNAWEPVPDPLPRARLVTRAIASWNPAEDLRRINPAVVALVDGYDRIDFQLGTPGEAIMVTDDPGHILMRTRTPTRQLLAVSESWHDGWTARVDGSEANVYRVYGDFMGVAVDAGAHEVEMLFRPESLRLGAWVTVAGLASTAAVFGALFAIRRRDEGQPEEAHHDG
jgi:hypothetical protein